MSELSRCKSDNCIWKRTDDDVINWATVTSFVLTLDCWTPSQIAMVWTTFLTQLSCRSSFHTDPYNMGTFPLPAASLSPLDVVVSVKTQHDP